MNQSLVSPTAKYVLIPKARDRVCYKQNTDECIDFFCLGASILYRL